MSLHENDVYFDRQEELADEGKGKPFGDFIGFQTFGPKKFRLYNVKGNHPLFESTVSLRTLMKNGIPPRPMLSQTEINQELNLLDDLMQEKIQ